MRLASAASILPVGMPRRFASLKTNPIMPLPDNDPVLGHKGGLRRLWGR